jgi:hypothetical protein
MHKVKTLFMEFIGKVAFNIDGSIIHLALHILINLSLSNMSKLL